METSDAKRNHRTVRLGFFAFLTVLVYAGAVALVPRTLITPWVPFCAAGMVAAATGAGMWRLWRRITAREKPFWNYLCHTVMMTGMLAAVFYISNYALADDSTYHEEETVLVRKYRETRHHSKRLSRARYVRGDPYYVYYMEVKFANGRTRELQIPANKYIRLKKGQKLRLPVARGFWNVPVIRTW